MCRPKANIIPVRIEIHGEKNIPAERFWVDDGSGDVQVRLEDDNDTVYLSDVDDSRLGDSHKTTTVPYGLFKKHWREVVEFYIAKAQKGNP